MSAFAAVVLDVDGTLYDPAPVRRNMAVELVSAHVFKPAQGIALLRFLREYRKAQERLRGRDLGGQCGVAQLVDACERSHTEAEAARAYLDRWFLGAPLKHLAPAIRPGLPDFLRALQAEGIRLAAFSDYPATQKIDAMGLGKFFEFVLSSAHAEVRGFKPDPSGLLLCAKRLGLSPRQILYVGDRPEVDAECARRAGMAAAILESPAPRQPSEAKQWHSVTSFAQLLDDIQSHRLSEPRQR